MVVNLIAVPAAKIVYQSSRPAQVRASLGVRTGTNGASSGTILAMINYPPLPQQVLQM